MYIKLLIIFLLKTTVFSSVKADYELDQSFKCTRYFSHYEKKYKIPKDALHSISLKETGKAHSLYKIKIVWPWSVHFQGKSLYFNTKQEAARFIKKQIKKNNKNIDVGCMQINLMYHGSNFQSAEHALDPKFNIDFAAKFLVEKFAKAGSWHKAIAHYHSMSPRGEKYSKSVFKIANNLEHDRKAIRKYYIASKSSNRIFNSFFKRRVSKF